MIEASHERVTAFQSILLCLGGIGGCLATVSDLASAHVYILLELVIVLHSVKGAVLGQLIALGVGQLLSFCELLTCKPILISPELMQCMFA